MAELKRTEVGNQATEQGAFEGGADPSAINVSEIPHSRPEIEVDAEVIDGDMVITPTDAGDITYDKVVNAFARGYVRNRFRESLGELQEGPQDIMNAQLLDEPDEKGLEIRRVNGVEIEARAERFSEISRRSPREALVWYGYSPDGLSAVLGDRVDILRDVLESAYSCKTCHGKGHIEAVCGNCRGTKYEEVRPSLPCRACMVLGFGMEIKHSSGHRRCDACAATGWRGGVVIPEQAQQEAITGIVVSIGPECRLLKIGDRVVHSKYAGHTLKMSEDNAIVTMRESEVLKILRQR
jgi:co-chaperonin GroES (HSP10)